jgi:SNF2 family DNA or RNA helicase
MLSQLVKIAKVARHTSSDPKRACSCCQRPLLQMPTDAKGERHAWCQLTKTAETTHSHTHTQNGSTYDINQLNTLLSQRPIETVPLSQISGLNRSRRNGFSPVSRYPSADTKLPVILDEQGKLIDGQHRIARLSDTGSTAVTARRATLADMLAVKQADLKPETKTKPHQQSFAEQASQTDGILALHGLGTGKSLSSITAAEKLGEPANVVVPASLRPNFKGQLKRFTTGEPKDRYTVSSYNKAAKGTEAVEPKPTLIADEVQQVRNQGTQYKGLMDLARHSKHRVLLSGTPLVNGPGDLASVINLLHGKQMYDPATFEQRFSGEKIKQPFLGLFGQGKVEPHINHREELLDLLKGRVHYVDDIGDTKPQVKNDEVAVPMSQTQDHLTKAMAGQLSPLLRWKVRHNLPPSKKQMTQLNSFLSGSRQVGLSPYGFDKRLDPYQSFLQSPKMVASFSRLRQEMQDNPAAKIAIYSNFINNGLMPYSTALTKHGIDHELFHGGMSDSARKAGLERYNSGQSRVVLIGPAGSQGISLMGTTGFHVLDPHFNDARTTQAKGRAVRLDSHIHLPPEARNVGITQFVSEPRKNFFQRIGNLKPSVGTDRYLLNHAKTKQEKLDAFVDVLKQASQMPA